MATGVIRWFHETHGYGFIEDSQQQTPLYVHHTDIEGRGYRSLRPGQKVSYEILRDGHDVRAVEVKAL
ncbi:MAG TPA: cold shock domain-containing protein [Candidatus Krumholzibacteria bacterium]|jgi:CspA family cold shock protein